MTKRGLAIESWDEASTASFLTQPYSLVIKKSSRSIFISWKTAEILEEKKYLKQSSFWCFGRNLSLFYQKYPNLYKKSGFVFLAGELGLLFTSWTGLILLRNEHDHGCRTTNAITHGLRHAFIFRHFIGVKPNCEALIKNWINKVSKSVCSKSCKMKPFAWRGAKNSSQIKLSKMKKMKFVLNWSTIKKTKN